MLRRIGTALGIGGLLALSLGTGTLHAGAVTTQTTVTTVTSSSASNTSLSGESVTLTATIVPTGGSVPPTGTVQFKDGGLNLGNLQTVTAGAPPNGIAVLTTSFMVAAVHHLTALYSGDAVNATSTSGNMNQTVNVGPATKIAVGASPASILANQTGTKSTVTATVEDVGGNTVTTGAPATASLTFVTSAGTMATSTATAAAGVATDQLTASTSTLGGTDTVTVSGTGLASGSTMVSEVGTNTNYVNAAYTTLLGHPADAQGLSFWVGRLNGGMPRSGLAMALATTPEYRTDVIGAAGGHDFYTLYLDRAFDATGATYWVSRMSGVGGPMLSFEQVRLQFAGSPEYFTSAAVGNNDKLTAIRALYTDLLGRGDGGDSDTAGQAYWMGHYNAGVIAAQFLFSPEGRAFLVNSVYQQILARPAENPGGLPFWTNALLGGASDENIIGSILGSDEYYSTHH